MKRMITVLCALTLSLLCCACGPEYTVQTDNTKAPIESPAGTTAPSKTAAPAKTAAPSSAPATTAAPAPERYVIENGLITMTAPSSIRKRIVAETKYWSSNGISITFYEANQYQRHQSNNSSPDGELFDIVAFPIDDDFYLELPSYDELGTLTGPSGSYRLIVYYPTDLRVDPDNHADYEEMLSYKDDLISTIQGAREYHYFPN